MKWVLVSSLALYVVANLPLVYSLIYVHGRPGLSALWGYSPNQFFFLVAVFSFATLYTFLALRFLVLDVRSRIHPESAARALLENWSALLVGCLCLGSIMTILVYFSAPMSLDKLKPQYAQLALEAMDRVDELIQPAENQEAERAKLLSEARENAARIEPQYGTDLSMQLEELASKQPAVYLHLVQTPSFQLKINIMHPVVHALNVAQLCAALFVAATLIAATSLLASVVGLEGWNVADVSELQRTVSSLRLGLAFFAIYPIAYYLQREQLQDYVDIRGVALQHVISGLLVLVVLFWLNALAPSSGFFSPSTFVRYAPLAVLGSGYGLTLFAPAVLRQTIGKESHLGWQIIIGLLIAMFALFPLVPLLWTKD